MSRNYHRLDSRSFRSRDRNWSRNDYPYRKRSLSSRDRDKCRSRSANREVDRHRSRSPRKSNNDILDENILSEISKVPETNELCDYQIQDRYSIPVPANFGQDNYRGNYQPPPSQYTGIYEDFPMMGSHSGQGDVAWNQMSLTPMQQSVPPAAYNAEDQVKKAAAIETEMRHQKVALSKQREEYIKKSAILKKELDNLKDQRSELRGDSKRSPSPDTKRFLKENTKLQLEIQNKLKTIDNVVDMLNGIIGEEAQEVAETEEPAERNPKRKSRSPTAKKFNYVYYDPEMHWCRLCNEFPPTAKDYLNHLHSQAHHKMASAHMEAPWHSVNGVNEGFPNFASAPTKRTPIKGLQFFVPSTAWYCKLCDQFIGDLHCASAHLKSITHSKNYTNFVEQNPHWETDWMSDRQKAFEKSRENTKTKDEETPQQYMSHTITFSKDGFHTKRKDTPPPANSDRHKKKKEKKKSKRKSSCSSSSGSSSSDRDKHSPKKRKNKKQKSKPDDTHLTDWISSIQVDKLNASDRKLLDNIKTRINLDGHADRRRRREHSPPHKSREKQSHEYKARDERRNDQRDDQRDGRRDGRRDERRDERRHDRSDERSNVRRDVRSNERRDERSNERRDERSADRRGERRETPGAETKKPEIRKMPFIGKMPVYKNLSKNPKVEPKKEEDKSKEDEEVSRKRQEEIDAEIQKKVAEFKEKIARAQEEREQAELAAVPPILLPPPLMPMPLPAPTPMPAPVPLQAPGTQPSQSNLPKDFQEALDIIFPSEMKNEMSQQDMFSGLPQELKSGIPPGFPAGLGGVMNPYQAMGLLGDPPPMMMGYSHPIFHTQQLYDNQVPIITNDKSRNPNQNRKQTQNKYKRKQQKKQNSSNKKSDSNNKSSDSEKEAAAKREELDDLAMLGIDASDVGAGM